MSSIEFSRFLFVLSGYNLFKLLWFLGAIPIPEYGLESSFPFHALLGYRGLKLWSHPVLFLAPHTIMGSSLLTLYGLHLRGVEYVAGMSLVGLFFAIAYLFAAHVWPERAGVPDRIANGLPINEICILMILLSIVAGSKSVDVGMKVAVVPLLAAAGLELLPVIWCAVMKIVCHGKYVPESPEKGIDASEPLPRNMRGYSGCPFARELDVTDLGYPPLSTASKKTN